MSEDALKLMRDVTYSGRKAGFSATKDNETNEGFSDNEGTSDAD